MIQSNIFQVFRTINMNNIIYSKNHVIYEIMEIIIHESNPFNYGDYIFLTFSKINVIVKMSVFFK